MSGTRPTRGGDRRVVKCDFQRRRARQVGDDPDGAFTRRSREWEDAEERVAEALWGCRHDPGMASLWATVLLGPQTPNLGTVHDVLRKALDRALDDARSRQWLPEDLVQVVRQRAGNGAVDTLARAIRVYTERFRVTDTPPGWQQQAGALAAPDPELSIPDRPSVPPLLAVTAVLRALPAIPRVSAPPPAGPDGQRARHLHEVRGLLAKAESAIFAAEAEDLSTRAQHVLSRYALAVLLDAGAGRAAAMPLVRRLWPPAPYVQEKATLVNAVADANRCHSVFSSDVGFCTLVGSEDDLHAVDVLVTSLFIQADAAMRRPVDPRPANTVAAGSRTAPGNRTAPGAAPRASCNFGRDSGVSRAADTTTPPPKMGASRTRSLRRAFLVSYATRIGERLTEAVDAAITDTGARERLLPVLVKQSDAVQTRVEELSPQTSERTATVTDLGSWAAGRAVVDAARLAERLALRPDPA